MAKQKEYFILPDLLKHRCELSPSKTVYRFLNHDGEEVSSLTYCELDRKAMMLSSCLISTLKLETNDRVLLVFPPCLEFICTFWACCYAGVVAVPLHPPFAGRIASDTTHIERIAQDCRAKLIVSSQELLPVLQNLTATLIEIGADTVWGNLCFFTIHEEPTDESPQDLQVNDLPPKVYGSSIVFLQYTSGSTGNPKGVVVTHNNLLHNLSLLVHKDCLDISSESTFVSWLPHFHDMGLILGYLCPIFAGASGVYMSPTSFIRDPLLWLKAISQYKGTHTAAPNFAYGLVTKRFHSNPVNIELSSLKRMLNAAEPVRWCDLKEFISTFENHGLPKLVLVPGYGLAEHTLYVSIGYCRHPTRVINVERHILEQEGRVVVMHSAIGTGEVLGNTDEVSNLISLVGHGHPIEDVCVKIVDPRTFLEVRAGCVGEIWINSPSKAEGYFGKGEQSNQDFCATIDGSQQKFLRTGDLGFFYEEELFIAGRMKDLIIIRGRNIFPQDIEFTVEGVSEAVRPGCIAVFTKDENSEEIVVVVEIREPETLHKVLVELAENIARKVSVLHSVDVWSVSIIHPRTIPKTTSGKIQRRYCRTKFHEGTLNELYRGMFGSGIKQIPSYWGNEELMQQMVTKKDSLETDDTTLTISCTAEQMKYAIENKDATHRHVYLGVVLQNLIESHFGKYIDIDLPFFEAGFTSLMLVRLTKVLEDFLNQKIEISFVFDHPTISDIANWIDQCWTIKSEDEKSVCIQNRYQIIRNMSAQIDLHLAVEPIAIIGTSCRFPGNSYSPDQLWAMIIEKGSGITEIPRERWSKRDSEIEPIKFGGFIHDLADFDNEFFKISDIEASRMDPQQRLFLEVGWEALKASGFIQEELKGSNTGVFVGACTTDFAQIVTNHNQVYYLTGSSNSIIANRLSYVLGLRGPSMTIDTACSSSLVALDSACQSLTYQSCSLAVVAGVNAILTSQNSLKLLNMGMLAPDGQCKTFDASANGYVRGEGCGVIICKRLCDAIELGDSILAVVRGSCVNQDGRTAGLTAPSGQAQQLVIQRALDCAAVPFSSINFVETHGTGTALGDPQEVSAIKQVLCRKKRDSALLLGAIKSNIGHLEAAAGLAGIIKAILVLHHQIVPPNRNLVQLNPKIVEHEDIIFPTTATSLVIESNERPEAFVGVSSFGFGGTNSHIVLSSSPLPIAPHLPLNHYSRSIDSLETIWSNKKTFPLYPSVSIDIKREERRNQIKGSDEIEATNSSNAKEIQNDSTEGFFNTRLSEDGEYLEVHVDLQNFHWIIEDHIIQDEPITPAALMLELIRLAILHNLHKLFDVKDEEENSAISLSNVEFRSVLSIEGTKTAKLDKDETFILFTLKSNQFTFITRMHDRNGFVDITHVAGGYNVLSNHAQTFDQGKSVFENQLEDEKSSVDTEYFVEKNQQEHYEALWQLGLCYGPCFRSVEHIKIKKNDQYFEISSTFNDNGVRYACESLESKKIDSSVKELNYLVGMQSSILDGSFQLLCHAISDNDSCCMVPFFCESIVFESDDNNFYKDAQPRKRVEAILKLSNDIKSTGEQSCDISIIDESGGKAVLIKQFYVRKRVLYSHEPTYVQEHEEINIDSSNKRSSEMLNWAVIGTNFTEKSLCGSIATCINSHSYFWPINAKEVENFEGEGFVIVCSDLLGVELDLSNNLQIEQFYKCLFEIVQCIVRLGKNRDSKMQRLQAWFVVEYNLETQSVESILQDTIYGLLRSVRLEYHQLDLFFSRIELDGTINKNKMCEACIYPLRYRDKLKEKKIWDVIVIPKENGRSVLTTPVLKKYSCSSKRGQIGNWISKIEQKLEHYEKTHGICLPNEKLNENGTYVITGGTSGIGLYSAICLADLGARNIALVSRTGKFRESESRLWKNLLSREETRVECFVVDVTISDDLLNVLNRIANKMSPIHGIIHSIGILDDKKLLNHTWHSFKPPLLTKILGTIALYKAIVLHQSTTFDSLEFVLLYSSIAVLGSEAQTNYSTGNQSLQSFAQLCRNHHLKCATIHWGPWDEFGMAYRLNVIDRAKKDGYGVVSPSLGKSVLYSLIFGNADRDILVSPIHWPSFLSRYSLDRVPYYFSDFMPPLTAIPHISDQSAAKQMEKSSILKEVIQMIENIAGIAVNPQTPLMQVGIDSIAAIELRNSLEEQFSMALSASLIFDYPSADAISDHIYELHGGKGITDNMNAMKWITTGKNSFEEISSVAVIGMACRFPGNGNTIKGFWHDLLEAHDSAEEVPYDRWPANLFFSSDPDKEGKTYSKWGSFINKLEYFDPEFFDISKVEAKNIDPQQKLLLEVVQESFQDAGLSRKDLIGTNTGVFVGSITSDFHSAIAANYNNTCSYSGTGCSAAILSARISYIFGLTGPCFTVDTACSSSLVALDAGIEKIRGNWCEYAVIAGVSCLLSPELFIIASKSRMLSPDGRCKTFDATANGYVRGEGCGVVLLQKYQEKSSTANNTYAIIRGCAVNQDGSSAVITAPNGTSQQKVIHSALRDARVEIEQVSLIETHGTGTKLGDTIEIGAIRQVYGSHLNERENKGSVLVLGALKTNIGHLEGAAGIASLIKTILVLQHQVCPPNLHLKNINPLIVEDLEILHAHLPQYPVEVRQNSNSIFAGISSFGFGGTNAHVVIQGTREGRCSNNLRSSLADCSLTSNCAIICIKLLDPVVIRSVIYDIQKDDVAWSYITKCTKLLNRESHKYTSDEIRGLDTIEFLESLIEGSYAMRVIILIMVQISTAHAIERRSLFTLEDPFETDNKINSSFKFTASLAIGPGSDIVNQIIMNKISLQKGIHSLLNTDLGCNCDNSLWSLYIEQNCISQNLPLSQAILHLSQSSNIVCLIPLLYDSAPVDLIAQIELVLFSVRRPSDVTNRKYMKKCCKAELESLNLLPYTIIDANYLIDYGEDQVLVSRTNEEKVSMYKKQWIGWQDLMPYEFKTPHGLLTCLELRLYQPVNIESQNKINFNNLNRLVIKPSQIVSTIEGKWMHFLQNHQVDTIPILPAAAYIELIASCVVSQSLGDIPCAIISFSDVTWSEPLSFIPSPVVPSENKVHISISSPPSVGKYGSGFSISSTINYMDRYKLSGHHASGFVNADLLDDERYIMDRISTDKVYSDHTNFIDKLKLSQQHGSRIHVISSEKHYKKMHESGLNYTGSMQCVSCVTIVAQSDQFNGTIAFGYLQLPYYHDSAEIGGHTSEYVIHPALIDGAFQISSWCIPSLETGTNCYLPIGFNNGRIFWHSFAKIVSLGRITVIASHRNSSDFVTEVDITMLGESDIEGVGEKVLLAEFIGLRLKRVESIENLKNRIISNFHPENSLLYHIQSVRHNLSEILQPNYSHITIIDFPWSQKINHFFSVPKSTQICYTKLAIDEDLEKWASHVIRTQAIILNFSWNSDKILAQESNDIISYSVLYYIIRTLDALTRSGLSNISVLGLIITHELPEITAQQAIGSLVGLFNSCRAEHSTNRWSTLALKNSQQDIPAIQTAIFSTLNTSKSMDAFMASGNEIYMKALIPGVPPQLLFGTQLSGKPSRGCFLISGGLGALGMAIAKQLIKKGAIHLFLISRSGKPRTLNDESWKILENIALQYQCKITIVKCDIAKTDSVETIYEELEKNAVELSGIIHSAGVLHDELLNNVTLDSLAAVMAPKLEGMINLHRIQRIKGTKSCVLIALSSLAALIPAAGQASYSAANCCMEQFVESWNLFSCGSYPALALQLGPISQTGMAASDRIQNRMEALGIIPINPDIVGYVVTLIASQIFECSPIYPSVITLANMDWERFNDSMGSISRDWSFLSEILKNSEIEKSKIGKLFDAELNFRQNNCVKTLAYKQFVNISKVPTTIEEAVLWVKRIINKVSWTEIPSSANLVEEGLDSLAIVDLRRHLIHGLKELGLESIDMPTSLLLEYPTIDALGSYILGLCENINAWSNTDNRSTKEEVEEKSIVIHNNSHLLKESSYVFYGLSQSIDAYSHFPINLCGWLHNHYWSGKTFPASQNQQSLWLINQIAQKSSAYHVCSAYRFYGDFNQNIFQKVIESVAQRHLMLRSSVCQRGDEVYVQVHDNYNEELYIQIEEKIVTRKRECEQMEIKERMNEAYSRPFDLSETLWRVHIWLIYEEDWSTTMEVGYCVLFVAHHIIMDGFSLFQFTDEIFSDYELAIKYPNHETKFLAARHPPQQCYPQFAIAQKEYVSSSKGEKSRNYWKDYFAYNLPNPLNLVTDFPRKAMASYRGAQVSCEIDKSQSQALDQLCRRFDCTPYSVFLSTWSYLLYKYTEQDEIMIGVPMRGRSALLENDSLCWDGVIGHFVNIIPLRIRINPLMNIKEWVKTVQSELNAAKEHEMYPFLELLKQVAPKTEPGRHPIFQVQLNYLVVPQRTYDIPNFSIESIDLAQQLGQFELSLWILSTGDRNSPLQIHLRYSSDLYSASTMEKMLSRFKTCLTSIIRCEQDLLNQLTIYSEEELNCLNQWNSTQCNWVSRFNSGNQRFQVQENDSFLTLLEKTFENYPYHSALKFNDMDMDYSKFYQCIMDVATLLQQNHCIGPHCMVGLLMNRSMELSVAIWALLVLGACYVPLDPDLPYARLKLMIDDTSMQVVLTQDILSLHPILEHLTQECNGAAYCLLISSSFDVQVRHNDTVLNYSRVCPEYRQSKSIGASPCLNNVAPAYVLYTSGSTGQPKGVVVPYCGIWNRILWMQDEYRLSSTDVVIQKTPFTFDVSVWEYLWPFIVGACQVILPPNTHKDPEEIQRVIFCNRVTVVHFVPSMFDAFLLSVESNKRLNDACVPNLASINKLFCSGEALPRNLCQRFYNEVPHAELHNLYGPTEASIDVSYWQVPKKVPLVISIGRPVCNTQLFIADSSSFVLAPIGMSGELFIVGVQLATGYLNRPDLTNTKFISSIELHSRNRFVCPPCSQKMYRSGDLARWQSNGTIEYLGRMDNQVKLFGQRIELGEIEYAITTSTQAISATVIEISGTLVAFLNPATVTLKDILPTISQHLPAHMIPKFVIGLDTFPLTTSGKIDRNALINLYSTMDCKKVGENSQEKCVKYANTKTERKLCSLISSVLGEVNPESIDVNKSFFALGGNSITAIKLVTISRSSGLELSLDMIYKCRDVVNIAKSLDNVIECTDSSPQVEINFDIIHELLCEYFHLNFAYQTIHEIWPATQMQSMMLEKYKMDSLHSNYHFQMAIELNCDSAVDFDLLQNIIQCSCMARKQTIGSCFIEIKSGALPHPINDLKYAQLMIPGLAESFAVTFIDVSNQAFEMQKIKLEQMMKEDFERIFNPFFNTESLNPLFRVAVMKTSESRFWLLCSAHHAIMDGWSHAFFLQEVLNRYRTIQGTNCTDHFVPIDTICDVQSHVIRELEILQTDYRGKWEERINRIDSTIEHLQSSSCEEDGLSFRSVSISRDVVNNLQDIAMQENVSLKSCILAALFISKKQVLQEAFFLPSHISPALAVVSNGRCSHMRFPLEAYGLFWNFIPIPWNIVDACDHSTVRKAINQWWEEISMEQEGMAFPYALLESMYAKKQNGVLGNSKLANMSFNFVDYTSTMNSSISNSSNAIRPANYLLKDTYHFDLNIRIAANLCDPNGSFVLDIDYRTEIFSSVWVNRFIEIFIENLQQSSAVDIQSYTNILQHLSCSTLPRNLEDQQEFVIQSKSIQRLIGKSHIEYSEECFFECKRFE